MDGTRFDELTRALAAGSTRRRVLGALAGGLAAALGGRRAVRADHKAGHCAKEGQQAHEGDRNHRKPCCPGLVPDANGRCGPEAAACGGAGCAKDGVCGVFADCGGGCNCWFTPSGGTRCFTANGTCGQGTTCSSDLDCPPGWGCASNCCGDQCFPCCGTATGAGVSPAGAASARSANTD